MTIRFRFIVPAVLALIVFASPAAMAEGAKVQTMKKEGVGNYLADAKGMTLYYFTKDSPGKSVCMGECLVKWPAVMVEPAADMDAKDFASIKRDDGAMQTTYRGYPLYTFFKDAKSGDTNGQGVNNVWYVVDPANFPPKK